MSTKLYRLAPIGYAILVPLVVAAQNEQAIGSRITNVKTTLNTVIGFLFVLATLVFLWGVIKFILNSADEKKRNEAKSIMTWGIVGLAVMAAVWGIANVLVNYFGVGNQSIPGNVGGL